MWPVTYLLVAAGVLHLGLLAAGILMPLVLDFRGELAKLQPMVRHLVWTYYAFIAMCVVSFGLLTATAAPLLASGDPLARIVCGFLAAFWALRLTVQLFFFDARPYLKRWVLRLGYHGLTLVFAYFTLLYGAVAAGWR